MKININFEEGNQYTSINIDTDSLQVEKKAYLLPFTMASIAPKYIGNWNNAEIAQFCKMYYKEDIIKPWGALFVANLAVICNITDQIPYTDSTATIYEVMKINNQVYDKTEYINAVPGDVFFTSNSGGKLTNVGVVIENKGGIITLIKSNGIDKVEKLDYSIKSNLLYALGKIKYKLREVK